MQSKQSNCALYGVLTTAIGCLALSAGGCQVDVGGQTLPSAYYQTDDIQYFPPGPEFKLSREAAAQKAYTVEQPPPPR